MSVTSELKELSPVRRELQVEIAADQVAHELDHVLREVGSAARIPGFRAGKVPRSILRKRFAREIENELLEHVVPGALREAFSERSLKPVHQPVIRDVQIEDGKPLRFTAAFEVKPVFDPPAYKGLALRVPELRIEEAHVEHELEAMRQAAAQYEPVEARPVERGDHAVVDLKRQQGEDQRDQANALIDVGAEEYHPEFTSNLIGMSPGESKSFEVHYGEDDPDPEARGKTLGYTVSVKEIKKKVLPVLDDEFAKDGGTWETLADLRAAIRKELEGRAEQRRRAEEERLVAESLVPQVDFELPASMVEAELERLLEEQVRGLMMRGVDPRTAPIDWGATREKLRDLASRNVKWELLLDRIAELEHIEPTAEEVDDRLRRIAESAQKSYEFVRSRLEKDGRIDEIRHAARMARVVDFILASAKIDRR